MLSSSSGLTGGRGSFSTLCGGDPMVRSSRTMTVEAGRTKTLRRLPARSFMRGRGAEKRFRNLKYAPCGAPLRRFWAFSPSLSGSTATGAPQRYVTGDALLPRGIPGLNRRSLRPTHSGGPFFHTVGVTGSIPVAPTTIFPVVLGT